MKLYNSKNAIPTLVCATLLAAFTSGAHGSVIQDVSNGAGTINNDFGQSFLATEDYVNIGFYFEEWYGPGTRTAFPDGTDFTIGFSLYEGEGFSGPLLKSFEAPDPGVGFADFYYFDLSDIDFNNGTSYTARIYSDEGMWGIDYNRNYNYASEDFYTGGTRYRSGNAVNGDMRFRLNSVPEPVPLGLLILGLPCIFAIARRRARNMGNADYVSPRKIICS